MDERREYVIAPEAGAWVVLGPDGRRVGTYATMADAAEAADAWNGDVDDNRAWLTNETEGR